MNVLITGAAGQLGRAIVETAPDGMDVFALPREKLDIADAREVATVFGIVGPQLVINAAGFTNVDQAERAPHEAARANSLGPKVLAEECRRAGAWLVHVSTAYVFDGAQSVAYDPAAAPHPVNMYGVTKRDGEVFVRDTLPTRSTVLRTSWLHAPYGRHFFVVIMKYLAAGVPLRVVYDQIGAPTSALGFSRALWQLGITESTGIFHWCDAGVATWYDFAIAIAEEGVAAGILTSLPEILPVTSAAYGALARRPVQSLLDMRSTEARLGTRAPHWRVTLRATIAAIARERRLSEPQGPDRRCALRLAPPSPQG